jgi:hypothetical protein
MNFTRGDEMNFIRGDDEYVRRFRDWFIDLLKINKKLYRQKEIIENIRMMLDKCKQQNNMSDMSDMFDISSVQNIFETALGSLTQDSNSSSSSRNGQAIIPEIFSIDSLNNPESYRWTNLIAIASNPYVIKIIEYYYIPLPPRNYNDDNQSVSTFDSVSKYLL